MDLEKDFGVFSTTAALAKMTRSCLDDGVREGRYLRIHRNVYRVASFQKSYHQRLAGAVVACGKDAVVSHQSAAQLYGWLQTKALHISIPKSRRVARSKMEIHRTTHCRSVEFEGLVVTSKEQTLVDLAAVLPPRQLIEVFKKATGNEIDLARRVWQIIEQTGLQGRKGWKLLRRLVNAALSRHRGLRNVLNDNFYPKDGKARLDAMTTFRKKRRQMLREREKEERGEHAS